MRGKKLTGMDRIKTNDERGTMNDELKTVGLLFIVHSSSFLHPVHPV
jgi:hypothetical protein